MSEWDADTWLLAWNAVDFSEVPVRRLWLHLPNPRALVRGAPWSTAYDAGFCPCLFVYRDRLDKSSVITSLFPPLFDYLRKALVLPTLLLKEDNSLIRWAPMLSIVQVSTPFVRTTNSFHWVSEWKWMSLWSYPHSMQCEEPSDQCFPGASPTRSRQLLTGNGIRGTRFPGPSIDLLWEKAVSTG